MTTTARPDLRSYNEALRLQPDELVTRLRDLLGGRLVAYLAEVTETRAVNQWASGERSIANRDIIARLRVAYQAAAMLAERDSPATVQAWFQGLNPVLGDRAPGRVLRDGDLADSGPQVLAAARQFAAVG